MFDGALKAHPFVMYLPVDQSVQMHGVLPGICTLPESLGALDIIDINAG